MSKSNDITKMRRDYYSKCCIYECTDDDWEWFKKDYFDNDFQESKEVFGTGIYEGMLGGASKNQNPYDLKSYSEPAQKMLKKWVKYNLVPTPNSLKKRVSAYTIKHWAEYFFQDWPIDGAKELSYVSTGAMKGALLSEGFGLKPYEFNAMVSVYKLGKDWNELHRLYPKN